MDAVRRLGGASARHTAVGPRPVASPRQPARMPTRLFGPDERSVLSAAVELYSQCLLSDAKALAYIESRAITRDTVERYRLGYCAGDALVDYLRWRRLPIGA